MDMPEGNLPFYYVDEIEEIKLWGRHPSNVLKNHKPVSLFWSASGVEVNVKTNEIWACIESDYDANEPWLSVWVDGRILSRFMLRKGKHFYCLIRGLSTGTAHSIRLMKDTQAMSGDGKHLLLVHGFSLSKGAEFLPVQERKLKLEFIGDSITSGEGLKGAVDEGDWISSWISCSENYAVQAGEKLNADYCLLSQCGWGVVAGWDNNPFSVMPPHYENVCSLLWGPRQKDFGCNESYDFDSFKPDYIFVNLGTNDNSAFNQPAWIDPKTGIEYKLNKNGEDYKKVGDGISSFLEKIRSKNPSSKIVWLWGMLEIAEMEPYILEGVNNYRKLSGDENVFTMKLESNLCEVKEEDKGSRGHPGPLTHKLAAEKIVQFVQEYSK